MISDQVPPRKIEIHVHLPTLADALESDPKSQVKKVFQKYGKDDPYKKKPLPDMQYEGDPNS